MHAHKVYHEKVDDNSQTAMVTKFEETLPFRKLTIEEFERRIKKLADPSLPDQLRLDQVEESFKDLYPDIT